LNAELDEGVLLGSDAFALGAIVISTHLGEIMISDIVLVFE